MESKDDRLPETRDIHRDGLLTETPTPDLYPLLLDNDGMPSGAVKGQKL